MHSAFQYNQYLLKRQVLALTGTFRIYAPSGEQVMYSRQKMFRLREDIRVYSDENRSQEVLLIQARQIIDFWAAYDVIDPFEGRKVGVLRRKGWRSILRDEWEILDANDRPLGVLIEDDLTRALLRRYLLGMFMPQDYDVLIGGGRVADLKQQFNWFRYELMIDFTPDTGRVFDRRLGIAAAILLAAIEGKQHSSD